MVSAQASGADAGSAERAVAGGPIRALHFGLGSREPAVMVAEDQQHRGVRILIERKP